MAQQQYDPYARLGALAQKYADLSFRNQLTEAKQKKEAQRMATAQDLLSGLHTALSSYDKPEDWQKRNVEKQRTAANLGILGFNLDPRFYPVENAPEPIDLEEYVKETRVDPTTGILQEGLGLRTTKTKTPLEERETRFVQAKEQPKLEEYFVGGDKGIKKDEATGYYLREVGLRSADTKQPLHERGTRFVPDRPIAAGMNVAMGAQDIANKSKTWDWDTTGRSFLLTMNNEDGSPDYQLRREVYNLATGVGDPNSFEKRYGSRKEMESAARQVNPNYDPSWYDQAKKTNLAYTSGGKRADNVTSYRTAINHIDKIYELGKDLKEGKSITGTRLEQWAKNLAKEATGSTDINSFKKLKNMVSTEVAKYLQGTGVVAEAAREESSKLFGDADTWEQLEKGIANTFELMKGRAEPMVQEYIEGFGNKKNYNILDEKGHQVLRKFGTDFKDIQQQLQEYDPRTIPEYGEDKFEQFISGKKPETRQIAQPSKTQQTTQYPEGRTKPIEEMTLQEKKDYLQFLKNKEAKLRKQ